MTRAYNNVLETICNTPLIKLNKVTKGLKANVFGKGEFFNPGGSVKDRIGLSMIEMAEKEGIIKPGDTIVVEPTSGNTGIALALVSAVKGYKLILTMPESMSLERRKILTAFGAELRLTPASEGMKGAIKLANEIQEKGEAIFIPQQFKNKANPKIHYETTGPEIYEALNGNVSALVAGIGTGGTITGVGRYLREKLGNNLKIVAVEPEDSPVLSGGKPGPHGIQGIGAGFVPDVLDTSIYDEVRTVSFDDAIQMSRRLAREEGIFVGISAGANVHVALEVVKEFNENDNIVTILCDTGERYLSTQLWTSKNE
ncbi:MAG: cysteine synthase A [Promethearchaeota archaeon]